MSCLLHHVASVYTKWSLVVCRSAHLSSLQHATHPRPTVNSLAWPRLHTCPLLSPHARAVHVGTQTSGGPTTAAQRVWSDEAEPQPSVHHVRKVCAAFERGFCGSPCDAAWALQRTPGTLNGSARALCGDARSARSKDGDNVCNGATQAVARPTTNVARTRW